MRPSFRPVRGPSIHFSDVGLGLGGNSILNGVTFSVEPGTIHGIVGPNGGGKTSLIRCLLGQMPHTGDIRICWRGGRTVGYVPQSLDFDDTLPMTVVDFMSMIARKGRPAFLGIGRGGLGRIHEALARVDMAGRMDLPFGSLSGGERQRVLLAQALIPEPDMLILDEPSTGLDKAGAAILHALIGELSKAGTTVIIIHHDLGIVREMAHGVTCINREVVFTGDPGVELTPERILTIFSATAKAA